MTYERRAFARIRLDVPACLCLYQVDVRHDGSIVDLSLGGCFFPVAGEVPIGEKCQIQLTTGEGLETETINLSGVIVRREVRGVGIRFTDISPENLVSLEQIISREGNRYPAS